jgi:hypothetical protein
LLPKLLARALAFFSTREDASAEQVI